MDSYRFRARRLYTNKPCCGPKRGHGSVQPRFAFECLLNMMADELGIDPIEIRKRNFLGDDVFPFRTLVGNTYDSGRYLLPLERAAEIVGYDDFIQYGGEQGAKDAGRWRLEGKDYVVQDGDVIHFRFNV